MDDPAYRRVGRAVRTAGSESLAEERNEMAKGRAMFGKVPAGVAAIVRVRAAAWGDDERLARHPRTRASCPLTWRPQAPKSSAETIRS